MTSPGAAALAAAAAAAPVHALSEMAMDRIWLLASTLPMTNYVKAEMFGLGKKVTTIHACVLMSGGCLYKNKDAEKLIYSGKFEIDDFILRAPMQTRFPQICQRLVESTRRWASQNPLRILYLCAHICNYCFSCAVLTYCVRTPISASAHDSAAHDQVAVYF